MIIRNAAEGGYDGGTRGQVDNRTAYAAGLSMKQAVLALVCRQGDARVDRDDGLGFRVSVHGKNILCFHKFNVGRPWVVAFRLSVKSSRHEWRQSG